MKSVDTNILVRAIVDDDPHQRRIADRLLIDGAFIPVTVFLETGWVLASAYRQPRERVAAALDAILDLPTIRTGDEPGLRRAIALYRAGADLADAIHLTAAGGCDAFVTFDRALAALPTPPIPIELAR